MCVCSSGSGRGRIKGKDDVAVFLPSRGLHSGKKNQGPHHHLERSCQPAFKAVGVRGTPSVTCRLLLTVQERWVRGLFCCFPQSLFSHWCWLACQHAGLIPPLLVPWGNDRRVPQLLGNSRAAPVPPGTVHQRVQNKWNTLHRGLFSLSNPKLDSWGENFVSGNFPVLSSARRVWNCTLETRIEHLE